jgi:hypothetical protein
LLEVVKWGFEHSWKYKSEAHWALRLSFDVRATSVVYAPTGRRLYAVDPYNV